MKLNRSDIDKIGSIIDEALYSKLSNDEYCSKSVAIVEEIKGKLRELNGDVSLEEHNKKAMDLNLGRKDYDK
jgi:hypothetical protein